MAQSPALELPPVPSPWALILVASLSKQIGKLQERYRADAAKLEEVSRVEATLEAMLFEGVDTSSSTLVGLAVQLDAIKHS